jgi:hypothetical protein
MNKQYLKGKFMQVLRSDKKKCTLGTYWTPCCVSSNKKKNTNMGSKIGHANE